MPILTDEDYQDLIPHIPVIRLYRSAGAEASTQPRKIMQRIMRERYNEEVNMFCGDCIARMYVLMNLFLDQYENG